MVKEIGAAPERSSIDAVHELRAQAGEIAEARLAGFRAAIESGNMSREDIHGLQLGLEALRAHANSPEDLMAYCQRYILGIDAEALAERGIDITSKPSIETGHARITKEIRRILDRILQDNDLFAELQANATLRERGDLPDEQLAVYDDADATYRRSLDQMGLSDELRGSFLMRAAEERRKSEVEARGLLTPEERLQQDMQQLLEHLKQIATETILSAGLMRDLGTVDAGLLKLIADSPFAKLIHSKEFRFIADGLETTFVEAVNETSEWLSTAEGQWDADPEARRRADRIIILKKVAAAIAAVAGVALVGGGLGALATSSAVGAFMAGSWAVSAIGMMGVPVIKRIGDRVCGNIAQDLDSYSEALAEVTGVQPRRIEQVSSAPQIEDGAEVDVVDPQFLADPSEAVPIKADTPDFDAQARDQERLRRAQAAAHAGQAASRHL